MKKINHIICLIALLTGSGCDSILEKGPLDAFTNDNFWTAEGNVSGYANAFYDKFTGYGNGGGYGDFYFNSLSDDQIGRDFDQYLNSKGIPSTSTTWKEGWIEVRRSNIMIEKVTKMVTLEETAKNHWIGVARLMRAWQYYKLVRTYGDLPWVENPLDITDEGLLYGARDNRDQVMDKVLEELNYAVQHVKESSSKTSWSRSMAQAMKAEICLYEGSFRKYRKREDGQPAPDLAGATKFLTACKEACGAIMAKGYSLNNSYQENYNATDLSKNPEMILYKAYKEGLLTHSLISYTCSSTQISGMSKSAFESYLFTDGKPLALTTLEKSDQAPMANNHLSLSNILALRDKRLSQTIDGVLLYKGRGYTRYGMGIESTSSSGYGVCKYDNAAIPEGFRNIAAKNYTHAPLFWLSVIYLNYAEACAELGTITNEDLNQSINRLKNRAGLPPITTTIGFSDPANNHGVSDLLWEIRRERRCELMFDNNTRYWDLIRWHQLDKLDNSKYPDVMRGANVANDLSGCTADKVGNYIDGSKASIRVYDKRYYLEPIPTGQIALNPQLAPNNPGWE